MINRMKNKIEYLVQHSGGRPGSADVLLEDGTCRTVHFENLLIAAGGDSGQVNASAMRI